MTFENQAAPIDTGSLQPLAVNPGIDPNGATSIGVDSGELLPQREILRLNRALVAMQSALTSIGLSLDPAYILETAIWEIVQLIQADAGAIYECGVLDTALIQRHAYDPHPGPIPPP